MTETQQKALNIIVHQATTKKMIVALLVSIMFVRPSVIVEAWAKIGREEPTGPDHDSIETKVLDSENSSEGLINGFLVTTTGALKDEAIFNGEFHKVTKRFISVGIIKGDERGLFESDDQKNWQLCQKKPF